MDFFVLVYSGGLLFFDFCQVFPNFQKLPVVVAMGRTGGRRTSYRSVEVMIPRIGLSEPDKKELII